MRRHGSKTSSKRGGNTFRGRTAPTRGTLTDRVVKTILTSPSKRQATQHAQQLNEYVPLPFMIGMEDEDWFHGLLLKSDGIAMVKDDGDFLVLMDSIEPTNISSVYILVRRLQEVKEVSIKAIGTKFCFNETDDIQFDTVCQLIKHYYKKPIPVTADCYLKSGVPRNDWELLHNSLDLKSKLGEGAQAQVQSGVYYGNPQRPPTEVALKLYKGELNLDKLTEIMHEVRIMLQFDHENVVKLIGIAACRSPMMIVLELVHGGGLDRYLKHKKNDVMTMQRISMCADAAAGLEYIHSLGIIHRDIAARNCLYSQSKQRVLISDFGLSQQEEIIAIDPSKPLPIRWLAPEVMTTFQCNKMTDVWSYGVLCWEVFYNCESPYGHIQIQKDVMDQVIAGLRLDFAPSEVPIAVVDVVRRCWDSTPLSRPSMAECAIIMLKNVERVTVKTTKYQIQHKKGSLRKKESSNSIRTRDTQSCSQKRSNKATNGDKPRKKTMEIVRLKRSSTNPRRSSSSSKRNHGGM